MSCGSSPTSSVRTTCGTLPLTSTMLMLSERWLTTHTSPLPRIATATSSMPTWTDVRRLSPLGTTSKISSVLSGVLAA